MRRGRLSLALLVLAAAASALLLWPRRRSAPRGARNVILISIDTLRPDHLGCYGYARATSPNIDAFFAGRTVVRQAVAPSPCTRPAVSQILHARLQPTPRDKPLAALLREHGYRTAAFVSQHHFGNRQRPEAPYATGFDVFDVQDRSQRDAHGFTTRTAGELTDRALAWLRRNDGAEPFFLWLHYFDPHSPYQPPPEYWTWANRASAHYGEDIRGVMERHFERNRQQVLASLRPALRAAAESGAWRVAGAFLEAEDVAHFTGLYDGEIRYSDAQIGRLLSFLQERQLDRRSVVVLTSDHGERLGEEEAWYHCLTLHEAEIRVPLLLSSDGAALALADPERVASTLDIVPTVLGLLGIEHDASALDGRDLRRSAPERAALSVWKEHGTVRDGRWKLYLGDRPERLYDVARDPLETRDLLAARPDVLESLAGAIARLRAADAARRETLAIEQRLRTLGYF